MPTLASSHRLALVPRKPRPAKARLGSLVEAQESARRLIDYIQVLVYRKPFRVHTLETWGRLFLGPEAAAGAALLAETPRMPTDHPPRLRAELHARLREALFLDFPGVPPEQLAAALTYELASALAQHRDNVDAAHQAIAAACDAMHAQVDEHGAGRPHPTRFLGRAS